MRALLAVPLLLAACGDGSDVASPPGASPRGPGTELTVEYVATGDGAAQTFTLSCDPPGGTRPDPAQACRDLAREPQPFAPLPAEQSCTQIYGGPQTAVVSGTYRGEPVQLRLNRTDGCHIAQWDRLGALLPATSGS